MSQLRKIEFHCNSCTRDELLSHLRACSSDFRPPLDDRVELSEYATKLRNLATTFEAWFESDLVGLVAGYENPETQVCFVSSVSVKNGFLGQGIARQLVLMCLDRARANGLRMVELEVSVQAPKALGLYAGLGFETVSAPGDVVHLRLALTKVHSR